MTTKGKTLQFPTDPIRHCTNVGGPRPTLADEIAWSQVPQEIRDLAARLGVCVVGVESEDLVKEAFQAGWEEAIEEATIHVEDRADCAAQRWIERRQQQRGAA